MIYFRLMLLICTFAVSHAAMGQRRIVVLNLHTHLPVSHVTVRTDSMVVGQTDVKGAVMVREPFKTISFSHMEFVKETLSWTELTDTMYLLPLKYMLEEVVVTGIGPDLRRNMQKNYEAMRNQPIVSGLTFDLGRMLDKRWRRDRKHYKKAQELLKEWDRR